MNKKSARGFRHLLMDRVRAEDIGDFVGHAVHHGHVHDNPVGLFRALEDYFVTFFCPNRSGNDLAICPIEGYINSRYQVLLHASIKDNRDSTVVHFFLYGQRLRDVRRHRIGR